LELAVVEQLMTRQTCPIELCRSAPTSLSIRNTLITIRTPSKAGKMVNEATWVQWFRENFESVTSGRGTGEQLASRWMAGEEEDPASRTDSLNFNRRIDSCHTRHDNVGKQYVGP
jgi:hypothetical protein